MGLARVAQALNRLVIEMKAAGYHEPYALLVDRHTLLEMRRDADAIGLIECGPVHVAKLGGVPIEEGR